MQIEFFIVESGSAKEFQQWHSRYTFQQVFSGFFLALLLAFLSSECEARDIETANQVSKIRVTLELSCEALDDGMSAR